MAAPAASIVTFDNSYAHLPTDFFSRVKPTEVVKPRLVKINSLLLRELGINLDGVDADGRAAIFSGNSILPGAEPLAMAYAGHQYGRFVRRLGDGRAILLGEVIDRRGLRRDIMLKGAGLTPFSRRGDGRAALGPVLREYIVSEAMHALGVPTTRSLAAVATGEPVYRKDTLTGGILTRVAASHVRIGTFQYFSARNDTQSVKRLADYVIDRNYPAAKGTQQPYLALLEAVIDRQAFLVAKWMHLGFIHGVMNTDNMSIAGETIDYGPCAFMDAYDPAAVFSSIDQSGRYAYANQPHIAQWNLMRFAETLLPILAEDQTRALDYATETVATFASRFEKYWLAGMRQKLGLYTSEANDAALAESLLDTMSENQADFTLTFRQLCDAAGDPQGTSAARDRFRYPAAYDLWATRWLSRLSREPKAPADRARKMRQFNPAFIPRNHRVEQALKAAIQHNDFSLFEQLTTLLSQPYDDQPDFASYGNPPKPHERISQTFCGT